MGVGWVCAAGGARKFTGVALCGCGRSWPLGGGRGGGWAGQGERASAVARHAVNFPLAPGYPKNGRNGAPPPASSRTRREPAPTLVGIEPPFSAQLITRPSHARSRTLSDLPPARSRGVHDARENPLRPTSAYRRRFFPAAAPRLGSSHCTTTAVLDLGDKRSCRSRSVPPNVAQVRKRQILDKDYELQGARARRRVGHRDEYLCSWKGFGPDGDTWEPFEHLGSQLNNVPAGGRAAV